MKILATIGILALAVASALSRAQDAELPQLAAGNGPRFESVSVKPTEELRKPVQFQPGGRFVAPSVPPRILLTLAFGLPFSAGNGGMIGAPDWVDTSRYNVDARSDGDPSREQITVMLQSLLTDRFKLAAHWEARQLPVYALVLTKPGTIGPQLVPHAADNVTCRNPKADLPASSLSGVTFVPVPCGGVMILPGHIVVKSTLADLAKSISWFQEIDRKVIDRTGLSRTFEITVDYNLFPAGAQLNGAPAVVDPSLPSNIFTALQEQLGLKLESSTGPVDVLVIDHIERPSEN